MSTEKVPQQLSVWSGLTDHQKAKALHKSKGGKGRQIRIKQKCVTLNQALIVKMRKDLRPTTEIASHLNLDCNTIRNFLVKAFGDQDPLDLHVLDSYAEGESAKAIGKRLNINKQVICGILRKHGIDPWKNYLERESQSFRDTGVPGLRKRTIRNPERPRMIAEDLYCFWMEVGNIDKVSIETGYSAASISRRFTEHISGYKEASVLRRKQSRNNRQEKHSRYLSEDFRSERLFQEACETALDGYMVRKNVRGKSSIEIDILVSNGNGKHLLIECKIRSRKPDLCKALGQSMLNRATYDGEAITMICLPDDVRVYDSFDEEALNQGVHVSRLSELRTNAGSLLI